MTDLPRTLSEYYNRAYEGMNARNRAYFLAGAGDQRTLAANEDAFDALTLTPRVLRPLGGGSTAVTLLGQSLAAPILVAPFAYHRLLHPAGERATATGAEAQAVKMILSAQSSAPFAEVRAAGPGSDWFQLYWMGSRQGTLALAQMALDAGYRTLVLTVDAPVQGVRDAEIMAGFALPEEVSAVNLAGLSPPRFDPLEEGQSAVFDRIAHRQPDWEDIAWLVDAVAAPVVLKGILHPQDALMAQRAGAAAVVVSNHGGRVLDRARASLACLPAVVAAVGPDYPVLLDGGIRRGVDILGALALGAHAVLVGRPVICGLAVAGERGVSHVLRLLRDELEVAMLLSGCSTLEGLPPDLAYLKL